MNYVDLIAILPFYVDIFAILFTGGGDAPPLGFLRILRLGRAFRLVKLSKYSQGIRLVTNAMANSVDALQLFALLLILVLVVFSSGIYYTERGEWVGDKCTSDWIKFYGGGNASAPAADKCLKNRYFRIDERVTTAQKGIEQYPSPFQSIPQSFWWCIVTLTTVGYGDMYPYTDIGKTVGVLTMLVGLIMLALPLSIIGTNFIEERNIMVEENKRRDKEAAEDEKRRLGQTLESDEVQVSVRKDLRELLAKADQLYESTGTMVSKLTACQQLLNNMRRTMVKSSAPQPTTAGESGSASGSGTGTAEIPLEEPKDASAVTIAPMPTMYAVQTSEIERMKELCLDVLKVAINEMQIWDPDGELPEMPKQISTLLAEESKKSKENGLSPDCGMNAGEERWRQQLSTYESVSPNLSEAANNGSKE